MNGQKLKNVDKSTYLGSRAVRTDDEVTARIAKASVAFGRLRANVWERNGIKLETKLNGSQCGQKKRYKGTLKASLKDFDILIGSWEQTAQE